MVDALGDRGDTEHMGHRGHKKGQSGHRAGWADKALRYYLKNQSVFV